MPIRDVSTHALVANETWVSDVDSRVVGFVNVAFNPDARSGEIFMIAVDPDFQRRGLAREMTELALAEMRRRGLTLAIVSTGGDPGHRPARRLYEAAGFTVFPQMLYSRLLDPN